MGTVMNGGKWAGAYISGNKVMGIVKDNMVFYRNSESITYKRRIMIGDNLSGKTIYNDFPSNYYLNMDVSIGEYKYIVSVENSDDGIYETLLLGPNTNIFRITSYAIDKEYIYNFDGIENKNNVIYYNDKDYIVSSVLNNSSYRCIYIQDSNIRPLKVGDNIVSGTKLYFNFPDNILDTYNETSQGKNIVEGEGGYIAYNNTDTLYSISLSSGRYGMTLYDADKNNGKITNINNNVSEYLENQSIGFGKITNILNNCPLTELILVDTTTLGE